MYILKDTANYFVEVMTFESELVGSARGPLGIRWYPCSDVRDAYAFPTRELAEAVAKLIDCEVINTECTRNV